MIENTDNKIEVATIIKLQIFWKAMQKNRGIKLLNIPTPIVAKTEIAPPLTA